MAYSEKWDMSSQVLLYFLYYPPTRLLPPRMIFPQPLNIFETLRQLVQALKLLETFNRCVPISEMLDPCKAWWITHEQPLIRVVGNQISVESELLAAELRNLHHVEHHLSCIRRRIEYKDYPSPLLEWCSWKVDQSIQPIIHFHSIRSNLEAAAWGEENIQYFCAAFSSNQGNFKPMWLSWHPQTHLSAYHERYKRGHTTVVGFMKKIPRKMPRWEPESS